jgi:hypothetical protein
LNDCKVGLEEEKASLQQELTDAAAQFHAKESELMARMQKEQECLQQVNVSMPVASLHHMCMGAQ